MKSFKMTVSLSIALTMAFLCCAIGVYAHNETLEEDIIIVARNYVSVELSNTGVVMGSKKGRFQPAEFKGVAGRSGVQLVRDGPGRDSASRGPRPWLPERQQATVDKQVPQPVAKFRDEQVQDRGTVMPKGDGGNRSGNPIFR
jgi:hypothetical protein